MSLGHVVVTGASSGIGEAIARAYLRRGAPVTLVARRREHLEALAREGNARVVVADLAHPAAATGWLAEAEATLGPIEVLVNNAGVQIVGSTLDADDDAGEKLLALDLLTPLRLTRAVLPGMIARGRGTIVDVSSMAAIAPTPGMFHYNAAKAGLAAASESLRGELRRTGVHVVTVYPGPVDTALARAAIEKTGGSALVRAMPIGTPEGLAERVLRAVDRRKARVIYPRVYALSRWFPGTTRWLLDRLTPPFTPKTLG